MASLSERLAKLEAAYGPVSGGVSPAKPALSLLLKETEHRRRELDGEEPGPLVLTPEEQAAAVAGSRWFLEEYIPHLREQVTDPEHLEAIARMEQMAREEIERGAP